MKAKDLIGYLSEYECFVDDDLGGHYRSIIQYTKDGNISKADTSMSALAIIDTFKDLQQELDSLKQENEKLKEEKTIVKMECISLIEKSNSYFKNYKDINNKLKEVKKIANKWKNFKCIQEILSKLE